MTGHLIRRQYSLLVSRWHQWRLGMVVLSGLLLAACASAPVPQEDASTFSRSGRFSITVTELTGATEAVQGSFSWVDTGSDLRLDLSNPMGTTLARVVVTAHGATLHRSDGTQERAAHPDALVEKVVGSPIPVADLRAWLQGHTARADAAGEVAAASARKRDDDGRLVSFVQRGWQVELSRYDDSGPTLLRLARSDGGRRMQVRLAVTPRTP